MMKRLFFVLFMASCVMLLCQAHAKKKVVSIYSHGFGGSKMRVLLLTKGHDGILSYFYGQHKSLLKIGKYLFNPDKHHIVSFNYPDVAIDFGMFGSLPNLSNANVAQGKDIETMHKVLRRYRNNKDIIGYGYSRGAATWITALGSNDLPTDVTLPKALILEAPFATIQSTSLFSFIKETMDSILQTFPYARTLRNKITHAIFNGFIQQHNVDGTQPINVVNKIDRSIPILLVHAQDDPIIPINDTRKIYLKLVKSGRKNVYLLELPKGGHGLCLWGEYGNLYCSTAHAFYKKYNLPHSKEFAQETDLSKLQPSIQSVQKRINKKKSKKKKTRSKAYTAKVSMSF